MGLYDVVQLLSQRGEIAVQKNRADHRQEQITENAYNILAHQTRPLISIAVCHAKIFGNEVLKPVNLLRQVFVRELEVLV